MPNLLECFFFLVEMRGQLEVANPMVPLGCLCGGSVTWHIERSLECTCGVSHKKLNYFNIYNNNAIFFYKQGDNNT